MSDLELIFTMLGEASTTEISATQKLDGLENAKIASKKGGKIAGDARKNLEKETGQKIVSEKNYIAPLIKGGRKKNKIGGFGGKTGKLR